jgi:hypothetical protein
MLADLASGKHDSNRPLENPRFARIWDAIFQQ